MPPKKTKQSSKIDEYLKTRSKSMKQKKKIQSNEVIPYFDDLAQFQTCFEEQNSSSKVSQNRDNVERVRQKAQASHDSKVPSQQGTQCIACLQSHFQGGKCLLDCRHCLCNNCFIYWSQISNRCPACLKKTNSVMMIFEGSTRVKNFSPKYMHQGCQICGKSYNQLEMYYCDMCDTSCVHLNCQPKLKQELEDEVWLCKECRKGKKKIKQKGKSRYNFQFVDQQESQSVSEVYEFTFRQVEERNKDSQKQGKLCKNKKGNRKR